MPKTPLGTIDSTGCDVGYSDLDMQQPMDIAIAPEETPEKERYIYTRGRKHRRCKAMSNRSKVQCRKWAVTDREVCRSHGGATPRGIDSASYRHGSYSKALPANLSRRLEAISQDELSLSTHHEILMLHSRLFTLCEQLTSGGETEEAYRKAGAAFVQYADAVRTGAADSEEGQAAGALVSRYFAEGAAQYQIWRDIYEAMHLKTKLTDSYTKRLSAAAQSFTASEVTTLLSSILHSIDTLVSAPEERSKLHNSIHRTINITADDYQAA